METIAAKYKSLNNALKRFKEAINYFEDAKEKHNKLNLGDDEDIAYTVARDSIVHRFEFTIELFWKYVRLYLEERGGVDVVEINMPRDVIRMACQSRLMSEEQAADFMNMIQSRNLTSHIYKEEIAEQLARDIPQYHELMKQLADILRPQ